MARSEQEIEVKFYVSDLSEMLSRLEGLAARPVAERVHEINLRFDTPDKSLTKQHRVLRLRQDAGAVITYKGPSAAGENVSIRQEIEIQVNDFESARHLLEALGYQVSVTYEKYRATYEAGDVLVTLDEMPFGSFLEIEGPGEDSIRTAAAALRLNWDARSTASYLGLFEHLCKARGLQAHNLTFAELQGVTVAPEDLGLVYADR
jgi:adenylate cyclase, class 2